MGITNLNLVVVDNKITNIDEIISSLSHDIPDKVGQLNHLKTLKNWLASSEYTNKEELIKILKIKIIEYTLTLQSNISNKHALSILKDISPEFAKIDFLSTKPSDNDSNKYIDYLTFINESREVEMIPCSSEYTIYNFLKDMGSSLINMKAKEVFIHFKNFVDNPLDFQSPSALKNDIEARKQAQIFDSEIEMLELKEVENYKKTYGITGEVNITIDENGERLYRIKDGIIKFKTVGTSREMQVLKPPTINPEDEYNNMLEELNSSPAIETPKTESVATTKDSFDSLEVITGEYFNKSRLQEIIARRDVYDLELTYEEEHELNVYIKYLLLHMENNITELKEADDLVELIRDIMESPRGAKASYTNTLESIKDGTLNENELDNLEKNFTEKYLEQKEKMKQLKLDGNLLKKLELENNNTSNGIATVIVLMELITLALLILMFLRLDI